jgi:RHH-type proline utilization regulon transcriptional repressor/proline dehydrogenase/delta 1-pyrroline-5-carboxylate dehydrogenase
VTIRLADGAELPQLLRLMAAATVARSQFAVSTSIKLPRTMHQLLREREVDITVESDSQWHKRLAEAPARPHRIRLIGGDASALAAALGGTPDVAVYANPVTASGRVELLPFVHEQAISITAHRFGNPSRLSEGVI